MRCSKQSRRPLIQTLPTPIPTPLPPTRIQIHQVPTTVSPSILVVAMGIAVMVPPKVVTNLPRAPHPGAVAEPTTRGQGRVPHLGTSPTDVLTHRCPLPVEAVTRGLGPGPDLHCPHLVVDAVMTSLHLHHLGTASEASENARGKGRLSLLLDMVPVADVITAIELWTLTARTRLHPHLGMATPTGETETETTTSNTTSGLLRLYESGRDRRLRVLLG